MFVDHAKKINELRKCHVGYVYCERSKKRCFKKEK